MAKDWDIIITNKSNLLSIDFGEIWRYRDLLAMYVKRDIVTFYKQTILGPLWFVIQPLFTTIMFMFVFGGIAGISTDGIPQAVFYLAGLVCWNYFQDCLSKCSDTFNANQAIFGKVYFPRLVVPLSIVISNLIKMGIQFALFLVVYIYYFASGIEFQINAALLLVPVLIVINDAHIEILSTSLHHSRQAYNFRAGAAANHDLQPAVVFPFKVMLYHQFILLSHPRLSIWVGSFIIIRRPVKFRIDFGYRLLSA